MTDWEEAVRKVQAIHLGACQIVSEYNVVTNKTMLDAVAHSLALYKLAEDAVLGPLNEEDK